MDANRTAVLQSLIASLRQRWGKRAARLSSDVEEIRVIQTGFAALDAALVIGGLPRGRLSELLGTPTSGATTIALRLIARAQKQGDLAGYIDLSRTFDAEYAAAGGVDLAPLPYSPDMVRALAFGGSTLAHAAAIRLHVTREAWLDAGQGPPGYAARVLLLKHRLAPTRGQAQVQIRF